jgi:hypothetical protein
MSLLNIAIETLMYLIWPFQWPYVYIPLLPCSLVDYIDAPTPFIMGVHSSLALSIPRNSNEVIIIVFKISIIIVFHRLLSPNTYSFFFFVQLVIVDLDNDIVNGSLSKDQQFPREDTVQLRKNVRRILHPEIFRLDSTFPQYPSYKGNEMISLHCNQMISID